MSTRRRASPSAVRRHLDRVLRSGARAPATGERHRGARGAALIVLVVETDGAVQREFSDELRRGVRDSELWAAARRVDGGAIRPLQRFAGGDMGVVAEIFRDRVRWFWPVLGIGLAAALVERGVGGPEYFTCGRRVGSARTSCLCRSRCS